MTASVTNNWGGVGPDMSDGMRALVTDEYPNGRPASDNGTSNDKSTKRDESVGYLAQLSITSISELGPSIPPSWLWRGYVAREAITLFSGLWKSGKSTLISHLIRDVSRGGGLVGDDTTGEPVRVLVLSEEPSGIWARRRDDLDIPDDVHFLNRESFAKPQPYEWRILVEYITRQIVERDFEMVVIDTLSSWWPVANENDAGEMMEALTPLRGITQAGAGLLLVHHPRKGGGSEFTSARGSGVLSSFVDILIEMKRYSKDDHTDRRRVITALSRYEDTPAEQVIELANDGDRYRIRGDRDEAGREDIDKAIRAILPVGGSGLSYEDVRSEWPTEKPPSKGRLRGHLNAGSNRGEWARGGLGKKNDPYRYFKPEPVTTRNGVPRQMSIEVRGGR